MAISAVLAAYDVDVIREVTDPRTGIQTSEKYMDYMPHAGQLKVYCESVAARRDRFKKLANLPCPDFAQARLEASVAGPGGLANVFVPHDNPRYPSLVEWSKSADDRLWKFGKSTDGRSGIWVAYNIWDDRQTVARKVSPAAQSQPLGLSEATLKAMKQVDDARSWGQDKGAAE